MKNIHVISTDKPSRLYLTTREYIFEEGYSLSTDECENKHIYITSDEEIKEGDWLFDLDIKRIVKADNLKVVTSQAIGCWYYKKIILTTDQDLIKDGVQPIPDDFLEWFIKNPSCEEVIVTNLYGDFNPIEYFYEIIIPKEEPNIVFVTTEQATRIFGAKKLNKMLKNHKQETTLEEAAEKYVKDSSHQLYELRKQCFLDGAKWQQEQIGKSEFLQKLRGTLSDAEARRLIFEQFKTK